MNWTSESMCAALALVCVACATDDVADACVDGAVFAGALPDSSDSAVYEELWRVGGGERYLSAPLSLALSNEGRSAIADFELGELFVVEADGTWRGTLARRGEGPGELSSPVAATWTDDGALLVYDLTKPAILRFDADLDYVDERRLESEAAAVIYDSGSLEWAGVLPTGATAFLPGLRLEANGVAREVAFVVDPLGGRIDTLRTGIVQIVDAGDWTGVPAPGQSRLSASVAAGRLAVIGGDQRALIDVYEHDGSLGLRLCAHVPAQPLSALERGRRAPDALRELAAAFGAAPAPERPARHGRIVLGADRTIWVQRERRAPYPARSNMFGDAGTTFDVFAADGTYIRTLKLPPRARLQGALGDTIWTYEVSDLDEVALVAYRVVATTSTAATLSR